MANNKKISLKKRLQFLKIKNKSLKLQIKIKALKQFQCKSSPSTLNSTEFFNKLSNMVTSTPKKTVKNVTDKSVTAENCCSTYGKGIHQSTQTPTMGLKNYNFKDHSYKKSTFLGLENEVTKKVRFKNQNNKCFSNTKQQNNIINSNQSKYSKNNKNVVSNLPWSKQIKTSHRSIIIKPATYNETTS